MHGTLLRSIYGVCTLNNRLCSARAPNHHNANDHANNSPRLRLPLAAQKMPVLILWIPSTLKVAKAATCRRIRGAIFWASTQHLLITPAQRLRHLQRPGDRDSGRRVHYDHCDGIRGSSCQCSPQKRASTTTARPWVREAASMCLGLALRG